MGQAVCVIAGPVLEAAPDPGEIQKIMFRKKLPDSLFRELQEFYSSIAVPPELKSLESTLIDPHFLDAERARERMGWAAGLLCGRFANAARYRDGLRGIPERSIGYEKDDFRGGAGPQGGQLLRG